MAGDNQDEMREVGTATAGAIYLSDVTATVAISARAGFIALERVYGPNRTTVDAGSIEPSDSRGPLFTDAASKQLCAVSTATSASLRRGLMLTDHRGALTVRERPAPNGTVDGPSK